MRGSLVSPGRTRVLTGDMAGTIIRYNAYEYIRVAPGTIRAFLVLQSEIARSDDFRYYSCLIDGVDNVLAFNGVLSYQNSTSRIALPSFSVMTTESLEQNLFSFLIHFISLILGAYWAIALLFGSYICQLTSKVITTKRKFCIQPLRLVFVFEKLLPCQLQYYH